jgi:flagellar export protein FliJ
MKSKYAPLVKLKKKSLDSAERDLIGANNALSSASDKLSHAYTALSHMALPTKGTVGEFSQATAMIHAQHLSIEEYQKNLQEAQQKQTLTLERYKAARIDFEKFKYLDVQEMNAYAKSLKDKEVKMLDEIGTMTYKREAL